MKKKFLILLLAVVCSFTLFGCGQQEESKDYIDLDETAKDVVNGLSEKINGIPVGEYLSKKYPLDSEEVNIYIYGTYYPTVITDETAIKELQDSVDFNSWVFVVPGGPQEVLGGEAYYVKFNEQTTIAIYDDLAYGYIGHGTPTQDLFNIEDGEAYFNMNDEFLQKVIELNDKYREK